MARSPAEPVRTRRPLAELPNLTLPYSLRKRLQKDDRVLCTADPPNR